MLGDFESDVIGFESTPETERLVNDKGSQTVDLKTSNQNTQTTNTSSNATQADSDVRLQSAGDHSYDADKLLKFLNRVLPHLEEELKTHENSSKDFGQNGSNFESIKNESSQEPYIQMKLQPDICKEKVISGLSWNSSDVMLAVACCENSHSSWCCHETSIGLYNTDKLQSDKNQPTQTLKVLGCVRCIQFHNHIPSLLAAGFYNGEVIIWDLKYDEALTINKKGVEGEAAHVNVITYLTWRENEQGLWLVTAGRDGRIILWRVSVTNLTYEVNERFLILKQHLKTTAESSEHLEILHMDFRSPESPYFVVAVSGGTMFYCSLRTARSLPGSPHYKDPVLHNYKSQKGIILCVSCQPDLFASCGSDSEIHVYKYDQDAPVLKIHTSYKSLLGVCWIAQKELLSWGDGKIMSHKLHKSSEENVIYEGEDEISTVSLKISSAVRSKKIAVGSQKGSVMILNDWNTS